MKPKDKGKEENGLKEGTWIEAKAKEKNVNKIAGKKDRTGREEEKKTGTERQSVWFKAETQ